jgi:hypothetical protein
MSNINNLNTQNLDNIFASFGQNNVSFGNNDWTNGFINREQNLNKDNSLADNILDSLINQILSGDLSDLFGEADEISSDPKLEQGLAELQAKRDKGEKGDLFSIVKDSNGTERLIALRKNGESEVVDPTKYNVKNAQEALNVEKGVIEAETKLTALAQRQQKGEKGDLFDKISVNVKQKLMMLKNTELKLLMKPSMLKKVSKSLKKSFRN